jgi:outer membrane protein assembly factor BamB
VAADGKVTWKFKADNIVRSTPAVSDNAVFFGDIDGNLYRVDATTGKELWRFKTIGNGLKNEDFGFDRRAIISSPYHCKR